jgi:hypothetical protein
VPVLAVRLSSIIRSDTVATSKINGIRDRLQMRGIDARAIAAQVI